MWDISCFVCPIPDRAFFKQAVFQGRIGNDFLERRQFAAQVLDLAAGCFPRRIAG